MRSTPMSRRAFAALLAAATVGTVTGIAPASASPAPASSPGRVAGEFWQNPFAQERNKAVAVRVLRGLFEDGDLSIADRHIRPDYIQHNAQAPDGVQAIKDFARNISTQFPNMTYNVKRVLAQGDLVMVHSNPIFTPGGRGSAVVDIFRFQHGMIAEHWDVVQEVPETTVSGNDMFSTVSHPRTNQPGPRRQTAYSEKVAVGYFDQLMVDKDPDAVEYLAPEYHQHNPDIASGSAGLREQFASFFQAFPNMIVERKRVIADGDLVAIHAHIRLNPTDRGQAVVDIFRVRDGKVVEHWDVVQDVPETSLNDNTMF
ncbi:nuclear transport factor 2 family protein [Saccharothrix deserti]|uniref:nuclear transport factor 2 family protein n=1 Tax=Saccharothrix deserti TaxID=2593674 RepID=UPI00131C732C|nr:nuclear transport factor 2 family protein [Saccharothrix deserti]